MPGPLLTGATGSRADALRITATALVDVRQRTFLIGPGLIAGVNALFLGYAMYRSRLVPRIIAAIGLIGAPLIIGSATATMFGLWHQVSGPAAALGSLDVAWELSLGLWLTIKGFTSSDQLCTDTATDTARADR